MFIYKIKLIGFRNYLEAAIDFDKNKTIVVGKNAQGKTNLIEVIQVLSIGKSKRARRDAELVNLSMESELASAVICAEAKTQKFDKLSIALQIRKSGRRTLKINDIVTKPKDLIHHIYSVSFMVNDLEMLSGGPSLRRDWIDSILIQLSKTYNEKMLEFENVLSQRNSFLKQIMEEGSHYNYLTIQQKEQLAIWDSMFLKVANEIVRDRINLVAAIRPLACKYYSQIAQNLCISQSQGMCPNEILNIEYMGNQISAEEMRLNLPRDFIRSHTTIGPHRHDIEFLLDSKNAKCFASQGQKRTLVLALKLAELELLKLHYGESPILLLDDVLAELDEDRQDFLLNAIDDDTQVIITATHLGKHLEKWSQNAQILMMENGTIQTSASKQYATC